jgi:zinc transport system ATP-binding protein
MQLKNEKIKTNEILRLDKVTFSYVGEDVLKDISFSISKGDFVGLVGPNGSGKTTLLKLVLGILSLKKGYIYLFNKDIKSFNDWSKIGYVPQKATNIDSNFPATVYEIVSMGLFSKKKFLKLLNKNDVSKINNALAIVKMQKYTNNRISELSGGQQQRVLIAKALVSEPEILILDEPTTGVDQENQKAFYDLLKKLNKEGITIILVSHDTGRITKYVNKLAYINQKLEFYGDHKEFCSNDPEHQHEHNLCVGWKK